MILYLEIRNHFLHKNEKIIFGLHRVILPVLADLFLIILIK